MDRPRVVTPRPIGQVTFAQIATVVRLQLPPKPAVSRADAVQLVGGAATFERSASGPPPLTRAPPLIATFPAGHCAVAVFGVLESVAVC